MAACSWSACSTRCWSPGIGIVLATILGFVIGIARLSPNWLLARLAGGYVELIRNLPLLFQILFWYLAVLGTLPGPRQSTLAASGEVFLNNRGISCRAPVFGDGRGLIVRRAPSRSAVVSPRSRCGSGRGAGRTRTGEPFPVLWTGARRCSSGCRSSSWSRPASRSASSSRSCAASISSAACG